MKSLVLIIALSITGFYTHAQKVKYKDLYVLLRAKNYKDASKFLKIFIVAEPDHPNANYQMGLMLDYKINELDLLKEADAISARIDSSLMFFNKAYSLINAKDLKRHDDDYYELFKRRNLRTGKFEVILSDVQLDIENRKETLEKKKLDIYQINSKFNNSILLYEKASSIYEELRNKYIEELNLALGAFDSTKIALNNIVQLSDSSLIKFKEYKKLKISFDPSANEIIISNNSIEAFTKDAFQKPDFYGKKIVFYNFSEWAKNQLLQINDKSVFIDHLIEFDKSLEGIRIKIEKDSVDLSSEVFRKITLPVLKELKTLDPESLIYRLFQYKISQLNYNSAKMSWSNMYADSLDIGLQIDVLSKLKDQLEGVKRLESALHGYDEVLFELRYHRLFEESYTSKQQLIDFIANQAALVQSQEEAISSLTAIHKEKDKWGYWNSDTISLQLLNDPEAKYNTFYSDSIENRKVIIAGLAKMENKNVFYFGTVPSSRVIDSLYFLDTDIEAIDLNSTEFIVQSQYPTPTHIVYLIGKPKGADGKYHLKMIYFHNVNGIIWDQALVLDAEPNLATLDSHIEISQGEEVLKYQFSDGHLIAPGEEYVDEESETEPVDGEEEKIEEDQEN